MKLIHHDIENIRLLFEDALKRTKKVDRIEKMKIRGRIRLQLSHLMMWRNPTSERIFYRWENKLQDVFLIFPYRFRDELKKLLTKNIKKRKCVWKRIKLLMDEDDLTMIKIRICLARHQKNMISVYQLILWMVLLLVRNLQSRASTNNATM